MISEGKPFNIDPTRNLANLLKDRKFYISYGLIRNQFYGAVNLPIVYLRK